MHAGRVYTIKEVALWTSRETMVFIVIAAFPTLLHELAGWTWLSLPWLPIALIGTAVAFLVGFKNNASYDRLWEGRKVWGGIVNTSRTFGVNVLGFVNGAEPTGSFTTTDVSDIHRQIFYRHIAWLTALRYQLRQPRNWEGISAAAVKQFQGMFHVEEYHTAISDELSKYLSPDEVRSVLAAPNPATQLLTNQSAALARLASNGMISEYRHVELANNIELLFDHQGKCERIKNFPYPRQFATINAYFVWIFIILVPFGMLDEFKMYGGYFAWLTIPFSALVSWVFHTMEKIGSATENPFEGMWNDVPITALSRTIEIDLRQMLQEASLPNPITPDHNILL